MTSNFCGSRRSTSCFGKPASASPNETTSSTRHSRRWPSTPQGILASRATASSAITSRRDKWKSASRRSSSSSPSPKNETPATSARQDLNRIDLNRVPVVLLALDEDSVRTRQESDGYVHILPLIIRVRHREAYRGQ